MNSGKPWLGPLGSRRGSQAAAGHCHPWSAYIVPGYETPGVATKGSRFTGE